MKLRDYQSRTLDELWAWFGRHDGGRIAAVVNDSHARVNRVLSGKAYARVA